MEDNLRSISTDLFYKVRSRFSGLKLGEESGEVTINPEDAVFFDFDYMEGENPIGHVSISLAEPSSMKVYYSTGITEDMDGVQKDGWYQFLKSMRAFAKRRLMSFDARDITKDNLDKRDYAFLSQYSKNSQVGESVMSEGMYGTNKTSYQKLENTKLIVKHNKTVDETSPGARARNITALFVENSAGERFKYPFIHLSGARAMQRHVQEGGLPYDDIGKYIVSLSEQIAQLKSFSNYVNKNDLLNDDTNSIIERGRSALEGLKTEVHKLSKRGYYAQFKEQFQPTEYSDVPQDVVDELTTKFTVKKFNEEMKDVFPIIHRLMSEDEVDNDDDVVETQEENENLSNTFNKFETWVNELGEANAIQSSNSEEQSQAITELNKLIDKHFPSGVDGSNAIQSLKGIIEDPRLEQTIEDIAKDDPDRCIRPLIKKWIEANAPEVMSELDFGDMEETEESSEPTNEKADSKELAKFIYSFYDKETGKFPKGETGVLTMVEKKFGDRSASVAKGFIEKLSEKSDNHDNMGFTDKQIKMAYGVLNDPRFKGGNYSGAYEIINKIAPGLADHPSVAKALQRTNETDELARIRELSRF
jgi:hypothetical protein